ncbi:protein kinase regulator Ste50 [Trichophyton equinum CBS 127.97]|uniref:Protein kinase regulator Ste50 n=1 Tax=Trichophyton equinum (strain ATCC MYA-4606 / CBS 127.97) TaxID=559882 RepID=F2PQZ7_TRIEC|nr:protein kinase regulator Ste50 [Trichophyton equinum CBS 127.97]
MAFADAYPGDSDADDEYERSVVISPHLAEDSEASPTDSEGPSTENTPTYGKTDDRISPKTVITDWTAEECAKFVGSLGLLQYREAFLENEIVGEALIALKHDELKELGISSVGHRLTILKNVYEAKVKQGVPIDPDHYVPLSADNSSTKDAATQDDIALLIQSIRRRDERLMAAEAELRKLADDYRRLREELLPVFKVAKDKSAPLPYQPPSTVSYGGSTAALSEAYTHDPATSPSFLGQDKAGSGLTRTISRKLFAGGSTPKTNSPTHIPQAIPEGRAFADSSTLDPSAAAMAASSHLTASMTGGQPSPKGMPSPTSPNSFYTQQTLASRSYSRDPPSSTNNRTAYDHSEDSQGQQRQDRSGNNQTSNSSSRQDHPAISTSRNGGAGGGGNQSSSNAQNSSDSGPSVEIFKSFRVSMDDPCYKVLPAALKKYNIHEDWRLYALYIVYGDQERCLALEEKPLILFKQLDKDGRKPMFMLRRQTQMVDGQVPGIYTSSGTTIGFPPSGSAFDPGTNNNTSITLGGLPSGGSGGQPSASLRSQPPQQNSIQLPGGVL